MYCTYCSTAFSWSKRKEIKMRNGFSVAIVNEVNKNLGEEAKLKILNYLSTQTILKEACVRFIKITLKLVTRIRYTSLQNHRVPPVYKLTENIRCKYLDGKITESKFKDLLMRKKKLFEYRKFVYETYRTCLLMLESKHRLIVNSLEDTMSINAITVEMLSIMQDTYNKLKQIRPYKSFRIRNDLNLYRRIIEKHKSELCCYNMPETPFHS